MKAIIKKLHSPASGPECCLMCGAKRERPNPEAPPPPMDWAAIRKVLIDNQNVNGTKASLALEARLLAMSLNELSLCLDDSVEVWAGWAPIIGKYLCLRFCGLDKHRSELCYDSRAFIRHEFDNRIPGAFDTYERLNTHRAIDAHNVDICFRTHDAVRELERVNIENRFMENKPILSFDIETGEWHNHGYDKDGFKHPMGYQTLAYAAAARQTLINTGALGQLATLVEGHALHGKLMSIDERIQERTQIEAYEEEENANH